MISRRKLLLGTVGSAAALVALRIGVAQPERAISAVLHSRLSYLKLDEAGVDAFAADFLAAGLISRSKLRLIAAMAPLYGVLTSPGLVAKSMRHGEERIVTAYLLSSDFFVGEVDEQQPVRYSGLFNPWTTGACQNHFARIADEVV